MGHTSLLYMYKAYLRKEKQTAPPNCDFECNELGMCRWLECMLFKPWFEIVIEILEICQDTLVLFLTLMVLGNAIPEFRKY